MRGGPLDTGGPRRLHRLACCRSPATSPSRRSLIDSDTSEGPSIGRQGARGLSDPSRRHGVGRTTPDRTGQRDRSHDGAPRDEDGDQDDHQPHASPPVAGADPLHLAAQRGDQLVQGEPAHGRSPQARRRCVRRLRIGQSVCQSDVVHATVDVVATSRRGPTRGTDMREQAWLIG